MKILQGYNALKFVGSIDFTLLKFLKCVQNPPLSNNPVFFVAEMAPGPSLI